MSLQNLGKALERAGIICALVVSLFLSLIYRGDVDSLRSALAQSCVQKAEFHNASHAAIGASVRYYRNQLAALDANYVNQLKIIAGYPHEARGKAIKRVNANRRALQNVLHTDEIAYTAGVSLNCPH